MALKPIEPSNATTAWGLLKDVRKEILQEPKRADMSVFVNTVYPRHGGPECGTVGCLAGWIVLKSGVRSRRSLLSLNFAGTVQDLAEDLLGEVNYWTVGKFNHVFNGGEGDDCEWTDPGTDEHARAVVERLDRFMAANETALKKRKLEKKQRSRA